MSDLNYVLSKKFDETFIISFIGGPQEISNNGAVFKTPIITGISKIKTLIDETDGETSTVYFTKMFKYVNGGNWTELSPIENISGLTFNNCEDFELELYYFRTLDGTSTSSLFVDNIIISGEYILSAFDSEAELPNEGDTVMLIPLDTYKIFSLDNFSVIAAPHTNYDIKYRFTQDDGRTHTPWEQLTTENISTIKLNPLRFAKVQYSITNTGDQGLMIYDIILEGDFQNVSANYLKTNRYGLKEDCLTVMQNAPGMPGSDTINRDFYTSCLGSYQQYTDVTLALGNENIENASSMWNPYQFGKITQFANLLGNQVNQIFGWTVEYHLTDPDGNGIDTYMHENTLKNIVAVKKIKVIVPDNKFPVESLIINQFNLELFDVFEIHIMKDEFKNAFGITKRPSEDDIVYVCEANMLYYIKHAQAFKDIMNSATYYRCILEKYEFKTNMRNIVTESQEKIDTVTKNTTLDSIFGDANKLEEKQIVNKEQTYPTTFDKIRHTISSKVNIVKENIIIDNFKTLKQYYDLSNTTILNQTAINYTKVEQELKKSDNRSFIFWFNFNNSFDPDARPNTAMFDSYDIPNSTEFNLLHNYDTTNSLGYNIYYKGGNLFFKLNDKSYKVDETLLTNVWYAGVINLDQRQQTLDMYIYRRDTEITTTVFDTTSFYKDSAEYGSTALTYLLANGYSAADNTEGLISTGFTLVNSINETEVEPIEFTHTEELNILGSNIKYSNLRILNDVIPTDSITNIILEYTLRDEQNLILADNATKKLITKIDYNKNFR